MIDEANLRAAAKVGGSILISSLVIDTPVPETNVAGL